MERSPNVALTQDQDQLDSHAWDSETGTFDPVDAGVALVALDCTDAAGSRRGVPSAEDGGSDSLAEYMARETAYVDPGVPM